MATAYITVGDLQLGAPTDYITEIADDNSDGVADAGVLAWGVESACGFVDGYVLLNPGLPLTTITPVLKFLAVRIALYMIASRPPRIVSDDAKADFDDARTQLEKLRDGDFSTGDTTAASSPSKAMASNKDDEDRDNSPMSEFQLKARFPRMPY